MTDFPILGQSPVEVFDHVVDGGAFKKVPAIYAIETTAACDLACPMCLRTEHMTNKKPRLLDLKLLGLMHERGDFQGSTYIELQQAGEPTIHSRLPEIIKFLQTKVGVMVGLSTHGLNMTKTNMAPHGSVAHVLTEVDALTISIDSVDPAIYAKMRVPATLDKLLSNLDHFFAVCQTEAQYAGKLPFIELQLVRTDLVPGSGDVEALKQLMSARGWDRFASIRTTNDCFSEMSDRKIQGTNIRNSNLCLQPWVAVNVTQDGDVVSCCYIFDINKNEINYYGNLWENSLEEIWNNKRVAHMQAVHQTNQLKDQCAKCYYKSPSLIHQNIVSRLVRSKRSTK